MDQSGGHSYLTRLQDEAYRGNAHVHWMMTIENRRTGWLCKDFHSQFRETLTHAAFRFGFCCPVYSLMPDHLHLLWVGWRENSDQRMGVRFLRKHLNRILAESGMKLQKQVYDNVLREKDRQRDAFPKVAWYIRANPLRAGLVNDEMGLSLYPFNGCLAPGYPELDINAVDYWPRFWRVFDYLARQARQ